jgi:hypothetical protein
MSRHACYCGLRTNFWQTVSGRDVADSQYAGGDMQTEQTQRRGEPAPSEPGISSRLAGSEADFGNRPDEAAAASARDLRARLGLGHPGQGVAEQRLRGPRADDPVDGHAVRGLECCHHGRGRGAEVSVHGRCCSPR